ncbi:MAG: hypothetical protein MNPFHGCM_02287 [Gemmatimonadaceae bacterium]|nr:hypothetical protein [Gemmatimonadaceae bacterium]
MRFHLRYGVHAVLGVASATFVACNADGSLAAARRATATIEATGANTIDTLALGIPYVPGVAHPRQVMDVFRTSGLKRRLPLVLCVHGGSWVSGSRSFGPNSVCAEILRRGAVLASVDYRLSTDSVWPAQMHDLFTAVRCLRKEAQRIRADTSRVAIVGVSAGAQMTLMAGVASPDSALLGLGLGCSREGSDATVVASLSGPTDFLAIPQDNAANGCALDPANVANLFRLLGIASVASPADTARLPSASPAASVRRTPPIQLWNGDRDCTVAWQQMQRMEQAIRASNPSAIVERHVVVGAAHDIFADTSINRRVANFLVQHLR